MSRRHEIASQLRRIRAELGGLYCEASAGSGNDVPREIAPLLALAESAVDRVRAALAKRGKS